jgi:hypothetical protein
MRELLILPYRQHCSLSEAERSRHTLQNAVIWKLLLFTTKSDSSTKQSNNKCHSSPSDTGNRLYACMKWTARTMAVSARGQVEDEHPAEIQTGFLSNTKLSWISSGVSNTSPLRINKTRSSFLPINWTTGNLPAGRVLSYCNAATMTADFSNLSWTAILSYGSKVIPTASSQHTLIKYLKELSRHRP